MKKSRLFSVLGLSSLLFSSALSAETFTATGAVSDWNNPSLWGAPQMAGNDFVFSPSATSQRLTATSETFLGDSLSIAGTFTVGSILTQDLTLKEGGKKDGFSGSITGGSEWTVSRSGGGFTIQPTAKYKICPSADGKSATVELISTQGSGIGDTAGSPHQFQKTDLGNAFESTLDHEIE